MESKLREEKSALIKYSFYKAFVQRIGTQPFEKIHVMDLCADTKISKVTFFKYFPHKEDVLRYYMRVWCLQLLEDIKRKELKGFKQVVFIFDNFSDLYAQYPQMVVSFIGHVALMNHSFAPFPVKRAEKKLHFPSLEGIESVEIRSIKQLFDASVLEAMMHGEITKMSNTQDITNMLLSMLYGSIITAHNQGEDMVKFFCRKNLDLFFSSISDKSLNSL